MAMEEDAGRSYCYARRVSTLTHVLCGDNFHTHPPTSTLRRAISPGEGLPIFPTLPYEEQPDCPSLRASTEHILIVRGLRAGGIDQTAPHVSIISNRASNSCPQAVQRMQSDSTVNSSDLIPMPPQSGQRARWTL